MPIPRAYRNDRNAPWNDEPCPECPECQSTIHDVDSHKDWCPDKMSQEGIHEYREEQAQPEYNPCEHK